MRSKNRKAPRRRDGSAAPLPFDQRLVLFQWVLGLFGVDRFDDLAGMLRDPRLAGFDADNVSRFHRELAHRHTGREQLPAAVLLGYDRNIVRHWRAVTERRGDAGRPLYPKHFQYLALLFAEIYLDRYFADAEALRASLNAGVERFNSGVQSADQLSPFEPDDLRKLAFWVATGSGKTLLMHVNILQYLHYLKRAGRERELNRIILLTPNEGLSRQHLDEFHHSEIPAELFSKKGIGSFAGPLVEIIDIHKLRDDMGDKTVAVDAFESNNLVLVDEGHRGAGGVEWMDKRNRLSEQGFSFEYSATFGQAMKAAKQAALAEEYAKSILFDYSYRYFHRDGYGKAYRILNLDKDDREEIRQLYLTACLLVFYQQVRFFADQEETLRAFLLERPLCVFVGGSVNAVQRCGGRKVSDVVDILLFLAEFARDPARSTRRIDLLLQGADGLQDPRGRPIFRNAFDYLRQEGLTADAVFADLLQRVFNSTVPGTLQIELLRGAEGELALRLGEQEPFGLINVGDAAALAKLCEAQGEMRVREREFSGSLFRGLNHATSSIHVLIGSKKFSEGWNSWRVSTMGLMNIGRSEGAEIIQLFGRGVRLKGYDFSLKRSQHLTGFPHPEQIGLLETLNIFGIRADYMRQFSESLEGEGLPIAENREKIGFPVLPTPDGAKQRAPRAEDGLSFREEEGRRTLGEIPASLRRHPIVLDWYPKIQAEWSRGLRETGDEEAGKQEGKLTRKHLAFLDWDSLHLELERFKAERAWHTLALPRDAARTLLEDPSWYKLYVPPHMLDFTSFGRVRLWQEIAATLLKKRCERPYP